MVPASRGESGKPAGTTNGASSYCQVIRHLAPVKRRYAAHGLDDVLVETREEAKPVLAGHPMLDRRPIAIGEMMSAGVLALVDDGNAAGLASRNIAALEHHDLEAALDQLVRGAHPRNAAAEDDDLSGHACSRYPQTR